jgi:hypothetical protein
MKKIISLLMILLFVNSVYAQSATNATNQTTTSTSSFTPDLKGIYAFLVSVNPYLLIILGVILVLVSKLARFVGIILIIFALIHILFLFLK